MLNLLPAAVSLSEIKQKGSLLSIFFALFVSHAVLAQDLSHKDPVPPHIVQKQSALRSVNDAVGLILFSPNIAAPPAGHLASAKLRVNVDLAGYEADNINRLTDKFLAHRAANPHAPPLPAFLNYVRYTTGDKRITAAVIRAHDAGIPVLFAPDLNTVINYPFSAQDEKHTIDFAHGKLSSDPGGVGIQAMLDDKMEYEAEIVSQPLYPENERKPIAHEKTVQMQVGDEFFFYVGSNNVSEGHQRVNFGMTIVDPVLFDAYHQHIVAVVDNWKKGNPTSKMDEFPWIEVNYPDGKIRETFTDGKYNPNLMAVDAIKAAPLKRATVMNFAATLDALADSIDQNLTANPSAEARIMSDYSFSGTHSYGRFTAHFGGYTLFPPMGPSVPAASEDVQNRSKVYIYLAPAVDPTTGKPVKQDHLGGAPDGTILMHAKVGVYEFTDGSVLTNHGSFNASKNVANTENQFQFLTNSNSWIPAAFTYCFDQLVKESPDQALTPDIAYVNDAVSRMYGLGQTDLDIEKVRELVNAINQHDLQKTQELMNDLLNTPTQMKVKVLLAEKRRRGKLFVDTVAWIAKAFPEDKKPLTRLVDLALLIARPGTPVELRQAILENSVRNANSEQKAKLLAQLQALIGFDALPAEAKASASAPVAKDDGKNELRTKAKLSLVSKATNTLKANQAPSATQVSRVDRNYMEVYDFDGTLMNLPSKIRLYRIGSAKNSQNPSDYRDISIADWMEYRHAADPNIPRQRAKFSPSVWEMREPDKSSKDDSYQFFASKFVKRDVSEAIDQRAFAPAFARWFERILDPVASPNTMIDTAHGTNSAEFAAGLQPIYDYGRQQGLNPIPLKAEQIASVGDQKSVPQAKAIRFLEFALEAKRRGLDGIRFFDDESPNTQAVQAAIDKVHAGRGLKKYASLKSFDMQTVPVPANKRIPVSGDPNLLTRKVPDETLSSRRESRQMILAARADSQKARVCSSQIFAR